MEKPVKLAKPELDPATEAKAPSIDFRVSFGQFVDSYGIVLVLVLMIVGLTIIQPKYFLTVENLTNVSRQFSTNALLALGQFLVILTAGIDLSVGSVSALAMAPYCRRRGLPLLNGLIRLGRLAPRRAGMERLSLRISDAVVANSMAGLQAYDVAGGQTVEAD